MQGSLARELADRFDEFGLSLADRVDLVELVPGEPVHTTLKHDAGTADCVLVFLPEMTASTSALREAYLSSSKVFAVGPRITERSSEALRLLGIDFLDATGNAHVRFGGVFVDVRGRRAPRSEPGATPLRTRRGVNLFSRKRSQVIFALLWQPQLATAPRRDLAFSAGVSLGQAQETVELLGSYGVLDEQGNLPAWSRPALLRDWAAAYPATLGSPSTAGRFRGDISDLTGSSLPLMNSGESAVTDLHTPETLTVYSESFPSELVRAKRWRRDDDHPTILLRHKFWGDQSNHEGVHVAPWPLVYADLLAAGDSRQRAAAEEFLEAHS